MNIAQKHKDKQSFKSSGLDPALRMARLISIVICIYTIGIGLA